MTEGQARALAAEKGWTLVKADGLFHVLAGALPVGVGKTVVAAVENVTATVVIHADPELERTVRRSGATFAEARGDA